MVNCKKVGLSLLGILLFATPVFAQNPIESLVSSLKAIGFQLILLWLLTLAIVYGVLSHVDIPKSITARGIISIVSAFMVLIAAAGTGAASFVATLITSGILVAFGLIITMIFLEITGAKEGGEMIFGTHPHFFGAAIIIIAILVFVGAGGLGFLNIPAIIVSDPLIAILFFLVVMVATVWIFVKEGGES